MSAPPKYRLTPLSQALCTAIALGALVLPVLGQRKKKEERPLPLPPQPPMALRADTQTLDFHLSPLLKSGGLGAQIRRSLEDLLRETRGEKIVKLRAFVAGSGDARLVQADAAAIFSEKKQPLPVLTVMQVGALGQEAAKVVIEATVATHRAANPNGLAFFAGQTGDSLQASLERLKAAAASASVKPDGMLKVSCFTSRLDSYEQSKSAAAALFPHAAINLVQAVRDPQNDNSTCEAVAQLAAPIESQVVLLKEPRAALVATRQLVFTGLQLSFGSYLDDAHEAFVRLERASAAIDRQESPVQVNVFSLDPAGGSALRKTTAVPPSTFSVQTVEGLPSVDATAGIEAVLAPNVESPVIR